jgi:hypothetical protein
MKSKRELMSSRFLFKTWLILGEFCMHQIAFILESEFPQN